MKDLNTDYIRFSEQFQECKARGDNLETEFCDFETHPHMMPFFPNKQAAFDIISGKLKGFDQYKCGIFGGFCSGGNPDCREYRGLPRLTTPVNVINLDPPVSSPWITISAPVAE